MKVCVFECVYVHVCVCVYMCVSILTNSKFFFRAILAISCGSSFESRYVNTGGNKGGYTFCARLCTQFPNWHFSSTTSICPNSTDGKESVNRN